MQGWAKLCSTAGALCKALQSEHSRTEEHGNAMILQRDKTAETAWEGADMGGGSPVGVAIRRDEVGVDD